MADCQEVSVGVRGPSFVKHVFNTTNYLRDVDVWVGVNTGETGENVPYWRVKIHIPTTVTRSKGRQQ